MRIAKTQPYLNRRPTPDRSRAQSSSGLGDTQNRDAHRDDARQTLDLQPPMERRSLDGIANAKALKLGIAAQLLNGQHGLIAKRPPLALHPAARVAARYQTTAIGVDKSMRLGFESKA